MPIYVAPIALRQPDDGSFDTGTCRGAPSGSSSTSSYTAPQDLQRPDLVCRASVEAESPGTTPRRSKSARKLARLTPEMKRSICIDFFSSDMKQKDISARYGVERSTISKALRTKEIWLTSDDLAMLPEIKPGGHAWQQTRKRPRDCGKYPELEKELASWGRQHTTVLTDDMLRDQALKIAASRGLTLYEFKASQGWIGNFKVRAGYHRNRFPPESPAATTPSSPLPPDHRADEPNDGLSPLGGIARRPLKAVGDTSPCVATQPLPSFFRPPKQVDAAKPSVKPQISCLNIVAPRPIQKIQIGNFSSLLDHVSPPDPIVSPSLSFDTASVPSPFQGNFGGVSTPPLALADNANYAKWGGVALQPPFELQSSAATSNVFPDIASPLAPYAALPSPFTLPPYLSTTPLASPGPHLGSAPYWQLLGPAFAPLPLPLQPLAPARKPIPPFAQLQLEL